MTLTFPQSLDKPLTHKTRHHKDPQTHNLVLPSIHLFTVVYLQYHIPKFSLAHHRCLANSYHTVKVLADTRADDL